MAGPSSLELLAETTIGEVAAQERRGDALETKAGVLLGFAGVLVGLERVEPARLVGSCRDWPRCNGAR